MMNSSTFGVPFSYRGIMFIFWSLLIGIFIYFLVKSFQNPEISTLEILKKRYAKGEINKKEYLEKKSEL